MAQLIDRINDIEKIGFVVRGRKIDGDLVTVSIGLLNSTKTGGTRGRLGANELPHILNMIRRSAQMNPDAHVGFDYTLTDIDGVEGGFPMTEGFGFPYLLDFEIKDNQSIT